MSGINGHGKIVGIEMVNRIENGIRSKIQELPERRLLRWPKRTAGNRSEVNTVERWTGIRLSPVNYK